MDTASPPILRNTDPTRLIAFLRAINVGGHNVKMAELRRLFEELGFSNVETFIASGNVIFSAADQDTKSLEKGIERHLKDALGYEVGTFIRSAPELTEAANYQPFPAEDIEAEGTSLYISFLQASPGDDVQEKLMTFRTPIDDFQIHKREVYWLCRTRMSESAFSGALLERTLRMPATMRNVTTVRKIAAKYGDFTPR